MSASKKVSLTWAQLREGVRATFYLSVPTWDEAGQARIDRAVDRLLERVSGEGATHREAQAMTLDERFPGAPPGSYVCEEGWLVIGDQAWTEHEWAVRDSHVSAGGPIGRPPKYRTAAERAEARRRLAHEWYVRRRQRRQAREWLRRHVVRR